MLRKTVETDTGHQAVITTVPSVDGTVLVKMAAYWRKVLTPAIDLKRYSGPDAEAKADAYALRLLAAIMDEPEVTS